MSSTVKSAEAVADGQCPGVGVDPSKTGIADEHGLQRCYEGAAVATRYVGERFCSELFRLLHDRQVAAIQRVIHRLKPKRVLEIAPGPGRLTRHVQVPGGLLVCLEYNEGMIAEGRRVTQGRAAWVRGNGFRLPFDQGFDLVYTFRFVRHFHSQDRDRLYQEIHRILNPGGYFLMDAVNEEVSGPLRRQQGAPLPIFDELYSAGQLQEELAQAGLPALELFPVQKFFPWQYRSQVLLAPRANWLNRLVVRALERLPRRRGLEWIVTCRRA